jgi:hypothetical protein
MGRSRGGGGGGGGGSGGLNHNCEQVIKSSYLLAVF